MGRKRSASEAHNGEKFTPKKDTQKEDGKSQKSKKPVLKFPPRPDWHAAPLETLPSSTDSIIVPPRHVVDEIHKYAQKLFEDENTQFIASQGSSSSEHKFMASMITSGTLEDKVSALTLAVQESPLHNTKAFDSLLGFAKKKSRNQALLALGSLKDMLGAGVVLPSDRKLRAFAKQPQLIEALREVKHWNSGLPLPGGLTDEHLISWMFEDWLKQKYFELLQVLEMWCNDEVEYSRSRAITFVWELIRDKPEQEENLLRLLINKLGDTNKKIASRASHLLLQLQVTHPNMKSIIIQAIESELLFRPGQTDHAKYYAIITLNQTVLSIKEQEVANKLLSVYFSLFIGLLKKPVEEKKEKQQGGGGTPGKKAQQKAKQKEKEQEKEHAALVETLEKMIAQVLTGVNRAFPFAKTDDENFESQLDTIFRVTHSSNFNTAVQALMLIQQIASAKNYANIVDRFYRTLYESLLDPRLLTSSKQIMYLNLLYRSLKNDMSAKRVQAFVKRLLQIISVHEPPFACGVLYLIAELQTTFPSVKGMLDHPEDNDEDEEERFVDAPENPDEVDQSLAQESTTTVTQKYDGKKRDPEHSNADKSCLWDILPLVNHYHPSVSLFASRLLSSDAMPPKPDPSTHSLMHFLDRFAYRNAKTKTSNTRGTSIMQPLAGAPTADRLITNRDGGKSERPVNTQEFWNKNAEDVSVDEVFFHKYFEKSGKKDRVEKQKKKKKEADESEDEEEIWKALVDSRPEIEGDMDEEGFDEDDFSDGDLDDDDMDMDDADLDDEGSDEDGEGAFDDMELESGDEAFVGSDEEVPFDVLGGEAEDGSEDEILDKKKKQKEDKKNKKRKLKHLPTFASADDYAKLLEDEEDGM